MRKHSQKAQLQLLNVSKPLKNTYPQNIRYLITNLHLDRNRRRFPELCRYHVLFIISSVITEKLGAEPHKCTQCRSMLRRFSPSCPHVMANTWADCRKYLLRKFRRLPQLRGLQGHTKGVKKIDFYPDVTWRIDWIFPVIKKLP